MTELEPEREHASGPFSGYAQHRGDPPLVAKAACALLCVARPPDVEKRGRQRSVSRSRSLWGHSRKVTAARPPKSMERRSSTLQASGGAALASGRRSASLRTDSACSAGGSRDQSSAHDAPAASYMPPLHGGVRGSMGDRSLLAKARAAASAFVARSSSRVRIAASQSGHFFSFALDCGGYGRKRSFSAKCMSANAAIAQLTALTMLAVVLQGRHEHSGASTGALRSLSRMRRGNKLANAELRAGKQWPSPTSSAKTTPHRLSSGSDEAPLSGRISACEEMEAARPAGQSLPIAVGAGVATHSPQPRGSPDATAADTQFPTLLATADESPFASPRGNALSESDSDSGKMPVARHIFRLFAPPGARPPADPPSPDLEVRAADDDSDDASRSRSPAWDRESEWRPAAPSSRDDTRLASSSSGESARKSARHSVDSNVSAGSREHSGPLAITTGGATLGASAHSSLLARSLTPSRVAAAPPPFAASRTQSLRGDVTTGAAARDGATARATYAATRSHSHCGVASGGADERRMSLLDAFGDMACQHGMLARALEHDSEVEDAAERASSLSEEMSSGELSWLQGAGSDDEAAWAAEPVRLQQLGSGEVAAVPSPDGAMHCFWRAVHCCTPLSVPESLFRSGIALSV